MRLMSVQKNLAQNMLPYTFLVILLGTVLGNLFSVPWAARAILPIVFVMVYPMMVNVSFESLKKTGKTGKPLAEGLVLNFIVAPLFIYFLCLVFGASAEIRIALVMLAVAPASSMGLGYVGLSGGNMVSASVIVAATFCLSVLVYPATAMLVSAGTEMSVPWGMLAQNLALVLILPLVLGVATREYLEKKLGRDFGEVKAYFSIVTLVFLYVLLFVIFFSKGPLVLQHWRDIIIIAPIAVLFFAGMIAVVYLFNKNIAGFTYEDHQSVVFTTVSKNVALTIGILSTSFGESGRLLAIYPAIVALFQIVFLMSYLRYSQHVKNAWVRRGVQSAV